MVTSSLHIAAQYYCLCVLAFSKLLKIIIWGMILYLREPLPSMYEDWILIHKITHIKTKIHHHVIYLQTAMLLEFPNNLWHGEHTRSSLFPHNSYSCITEALIISSLHKRTQVLAAACNDENSGFSIS